MPLSEADQRNFLMLAAAFNNRDVALVECQVVETGETIPMICAINHRPAISAFFKTTLKTDTGHLGKRHSFRVVTAHQDLTHHRDEASFSSGGTSK